MVLYDTIGRTYRATRRPDPRVAAAIFAALGDARSVVNVGAGTGSYEPAEKVLAVEPSQVMIDQRLADSAPAVRAVAEALPLADRSVDAALAVLTVHHWADAAAGAAEMRRVARRRVVFFTTRPEIVYTFWLLAEYLPTVAAADAEQSVSLATLAGPGARITPVPVPHDCTDGFGAAYWRRPEAYLDPQVRAGISVLARASEDDLRPGLDRLADDLRTGRWHAEHADLLARDSLDVGYCTVTEDL